MKYRANIKKLLDIKGWTQSELSNRTCLTPAAISQIINGQREPSLSSLIKLSYALEVTIGDLINGEFKQAREFTFEAYLSEIPSSPPNQYLAVEKAIGHYCMHLLSDYPETPSTDKRTNSKWLINMKELELPNE